MAGCLLGDDVVDLDSGVSRELEQVGEVGAVGVRPDPVVEALHDQAIERAELGLDDMDAPVDARTDEVDVAVADGSADRDLSKRRCP